MGIYLGFVIAGLLQKIFLLYFEQTHRVQNVKHQDQLQPPHAYNVVIYNFQKF